MTLIEPPALSSPSQTSAFRIAEMPEAERPRERLLRLGSGALKTDELLAILLRTGTVREDVRTVAQRLLVERGGLRGLAGSDLATLAEMHGLGPAKATTIAAAFELGRRAALESGGVQVLVNQPTDIVRLLQPEMELLQQEELLLLILDTKHHLIASTMLYRGTVAASPGRVAEVFREAVRRGAAKVALAHNHPSGDPSPSAADIEFTRQLVQAGRLMDVEVIDRVVIGHGPGRWVSLKGRGLGFE